MTKSHFYLVVLLSISFSSLLVSTVDAQEIESLTGDQIITNQESESSTGDTTQSAESTNPNNDNQPKTLFGMSCELTRIPVSGIPQRAIFTPDQYKDQLASLTKKGYSRIDLIQEFTNGDKIIKILLGEKCDKPVLRINGEESINDIGIDHIAKKGNKLLMYGAKDGYATMISCDLGTLTGNAYTPFDLPKSSKTKIGTSNYDNSGNNENNYSNGELLLEKKKIHPQAAIELSRQPVSEIIRFFGGNWTRDRKILADKLQITNYQATKSQNLQIRRYLLSYIDFEVISTSTNELIISEQDYQIVKQQVVSEIIKLWNYNWKYDRWSLFQELGSDISFYRGSRSQNLGIRGFLIKKLKTK